MSKYEWEQGTIKLPTAEYPKVRRMVQDALHLHLSKAYDLAQDFWKSLTQHQKQDCKAYDDAIQGYCYGRLGMRAASGLDKNPELAETVSSMISAVLWRVASEAGSHPSYAFSQLEECAPRRVLKSDIEWPTNHTTTFRIRQDATITFNQEACSVKWGVPDCNNAVSMAHSHPVSKAFFNSLRIIKWTLDAGGVIYGNDEYNEDSDGQDGAPYIASAYGPVGAVQAPMQCAEYITANGRVTYAMMINASTLAYL